ncbi:MAG: hypothetical protein ACOYMP_14570 [Nodosilinea sp.]
MTISFTGGMAISPGPGRAAALVLAEGVEGGRAIALRFALSLWTWVGWAETS